MPWKQNGNKIKFLLHFAAGLCIIKKNIYVSAEMGVDFVVAALISIMVMSTILIFAQETYSVLGRVWCRGEASR